jgi:hypothetical protein
MKFLIAIALFCLLICGACTNQSSSSPGTAANSNTSGNSDWIVGSWRKTIDPDNDPDETITFQKDGKFVGTSAGFSETVRGDYQVSETERVVSMQAPRNGSMVPMNPLRFEAAKDKLYYTSTKGTTSIYEKVSR